MGGRRPARARDVAPVGGPSRRIRGSASAFDRECLGPASDGLRGFACRKGLTAASLAAPDAVFPPVTLLVGRFNTGGTLGNDRLLIGTEFYVATAGTPLDELGAFQRANVHPPDSLHLIIAHENIHAQQSLAGGIHSTGSTLLGQSLTEGGADFVAELVSGGTVNGAIYAWGLAHEHDVWVQFRSEMNGTSINRWLYNQMQGTADWPGDLGYFVGYRIAKSYYDRQADKGAAIAAIIGARDPAAFLAASGYNP